MIKDLISIANHLDRLKLTKEADLLDKIISKIAAPPMIDVVPLHRYEHAGLMYSDEDEDETRHIPEKVPRKKRILRDERSRDALEYNLRRSHLPREEEDEYELDGWYRSISALGDDIILIPFDKSDVNKNYDILFGLSYIFGLRTDRIDSYKDLYRESNILSLNGSYREGDLDKLKEAFPHLWEDISKVLEEKGKKEEEVIYMLYNQETSPDRPGFTKNPDYFAHDLGHADFDSEDADGEFKYNLSALILDISKLYISEEGNSLEESIDEYTDEDTEQIASQIFNTMSEPQDIWADIFGLAASEELDMSAVSIPKYLDHNHDTYEISDDKVSEARSLIENYILRTKRYLNPSEEPGKFAPGPLKHLAGKVVLQDV